MKPGPKPNRIVQKKWTADLAYAIGLIVTDGCLLPRWGIDVTSKDRQQIENFKKCIGISNKIGQKLNGQGSAYYRIQFRNMFFHLFLSSIGITSVKSKTISRIKIPNKYFFDFLRGVFDGDGYTYSYWDKRWRSSYMYYVGFSSASDKFVEWLQGEIKNHLGITGHVTTAGKRGSYYNLKYAKAEGVKLLKRMYYSPQAVCLMRKKLKINKCFDMIGIPHLN